MQEYKEYLENGVNLKSLQKGLMPLQNFKMAHESLVLFCHDIFVEYEGGILLIVRNNEPAINVLWPLGGRVLRGMDVFESAKIKILKEANLQLTNLKMLGMCRTYFRTDPFDHGYGTDSVNAVLYAKGHGDLQLDQLHEKPTIIKPEDCTNEFMNSLEPYVSDYLRVSMEFVQNK